MDPGKHAIKNDIFQYWHNKINTKIQAYHQLKKVLVTIQTLQILNLFTKFYQVNKVFCSSQQKFNISLNLDIISTFLGPHNKL